MSNVLQILQTIALLCQAELGIENNSAWRLNCQKYYVKCAQSLNGKLDDKQLVFCVLDKQ